MDSSTLLLYFDDEQDSASRLAAATKFPMAAIERHRFPDGARLGGQFRLAGLDFRRAGTPIGPPFRQLVAHPHPLRGAKGGGFIGINQESQRAPPTRHFKNGLSDEPAVSLAPSRVGFECLRQRVIQHPMLPENGLGDGGGGFS